jgi:hypothetical protein
MIRIQRSCPGAIQLARATACPAWRTQQAAKLGGFGPPSFREAAHTGRQRDTGDRDDRDEAFSAKAVRGCFARATVDACGYSSVKVKFNDVRIAPPSANLQRTGLMRRRRRIAARSPGRPGGRAMGVRSWMGFCEHASYPRDAGRSPTCSRCACREQSRELRPARWTRLPVLKTRRPGRALPSPRRSSSPSVSVVVLSGHQIDGPAGFWSHWQSKRRCPRLANRQSACVWRQSCSSARHPIGRIVQRLSALIVGTAVVTVSFRRGSWPSRQRTLRRLELLAPSGQRASRGGRSDPRRTGLTSPRRG